MRTQITLGLLFAAASAANAQPAPGDPPPPPPAGAPVVEQPPQVDRGVWEDANSGRGWFMPTALTAPAGSWSFSDYELLIVGLGYSPVNGVDLSIGTLIPVSSDQPFVGIATGKVQVVKSGALRLALHGMFEFNTGVNGASGGGAGTIGGVATICLDFACASHASAYVGAGFATSGQSAVPIAFSGELTGRIARHVKLVGEVDSAAVLGNEYSSFGDGVLLWYGVRFTSHNIGVDLGFMEPILKTTTTNSDGMGNVTTSSSWQIGFGGGALPIGLPFLSFTYRT